MKIIIDNITKKIGKKTILSEVSLELESGNVYGFVGRNGSGKTMLFRAVSGLMKVDQGKILCDDKVLRRDIEVLPSVGMVLEKADLFSDMTGFGNLKYLAGIKGKLNDEAIRESITRVGLDPDDKRTYRKYSLGMKQRILIAQAIMEKPDVIILDEPTNAIDEDGVELIYKIVKEEKQRGAIVLIASHNKEDIENLADKVFDMKDGVLTEVY